jgi:hypothetical protein
MTGEFDPSKSIDEHIAEFRKYLEQLDPECARILLAHQAMLNNGALARADRIAFNEAVLEDLKALPSEDGAS